MEFAAPAVCPLHFLLRGGVPTSASWGRLYLQSLSQLPHQRRRGSGRHGLLGWWENKHPRARTSANAAPVRLGCLSPALLPHQQQAGCPSQSHAQGAPGHRLGPASASLLSYHSCPQCRPPTLSPHHPLLSLTPAITRWAATGQRLRMQQGHGQSCLWGRLMSDNGTEK